MGEQQPLRSGVMQSIADEDDKSTNSGQEQKSNALDKADKGNPQQSQREQSKEKGIDDISPTISASELSTVIGSLIDDKTANKAQDSLINASEQGDNQKQTVDLTGSYAEGDVIGVTVKPNKVHVKGLKKVAELFSNADKLPWNVRLGMELLSLSEDLTKEHFFRSQKMVKAKQVITQGGSFASNSDIEPIIQYIRTLGLWR